AALNETHAYAVRLRELNVSKTRSPNWDTLSVAFAVKINGRIDESTVHTWNIGDHRHGEVPLGGQAEGPWTTFVAKDSDQVEVLVTVLNENNPGSAGAHARSFFDAVSDKTKDVVGQMYPIPFVWDAVNSVVHWLNGIIFGGLCNGAVAVDSIKGSGQ